MTLSLFPYDARAAAPDTSEKICARVITVLRASINDNKEITQSVQIMDFNGQFFIPLQDIIHFFDFPISIDQSGSYASGFFVTPEKSFSLDVNNLSVRTGATRQSITRQDIRRQDSRLYISQDALRLWFGISSTADLKQGTLHFTTAYVLPSKAKEIRAKKRLEELGSFTKTDQEIFALPEIKHSLGLSSTPNAIPATQKHNFTGVTVAGYEVELYRNSTLIAFQFADETGHYIFQDTPLLWGENIFRLAIYGPQGQHEEKTETLVAQFPVIENFKSNSSLPTKNTSEEKSAVKDAQKATSLSTGSQSPPILAKNWANLTVVQEGKNIGTLDAYIGVRGIFLRLDSFLRYLGITYSQQTSSDFLEIRADNNRHITLDLSQRTYVDEGQNHTLYDTDAFKNDDIIYANTDLLHRLFPSSAFIVDQTLQKIEIPEKRKEETYPQTTTQAADKTDVAPVPNAAPIQPVIIDDLNGQQRVSGAEARPKEEQEAKDVLHIDQPTLTKDTAQDNNDQKNGEPLILQPRLKNMPASNEFIEALDLPGQIFLPLNDLFQIIGFPIKFDDAKNEAHGFFFTPDNVFYLNVDKKEGRAGNKRLDITYRDVRRHEGQIYVSTESFTEWFGIICEIDRAKAIIQFKTDQLFPAEEAEQRQKRWNKLLTAVAPSDNDLPVLQNPYQAIDYPSIDVSWGSNFTHNDAITTQNNTFISNYNIQGAMELGYLTNQFYVQGATDTNAINTIRLQAGRKDPAGNLLGVMNATQFAIGDITSPSVSFVTSNSLGRGISMTNRSVTSSENFDVRTFTGDSVPGYEVELYRNNVLVSFQTVEANGRYNFVDIPILYGENTFRLVFYGNQGQREERIETVSASSALLKEDQFEYTLGAQQRGLSLIPINQLTLTNPKTPVGEQLVGGFRYGVTKNYTIGAGIAETILQDGPHRYLTTSSGSNFFGILSETSFAKDMTTGGWASGMSVLTGFEGVSLRGRYRQYNDFISESVNNLNIPLKSEAQIDANTQLFLPLVHDFSLGLSGLQEVFVDNDLVPRYTYGVQVSKSLWGLSFNNKIDYILDDEKRFQDTFGFQTRLWDINFRATGIYDLSPLQQFRSASFMTDYRLMDKLSGQSQIEKDLTTNKTSFGQNINWDFDDFRLSLNNQVDNSGDYAVGMNVLFSLNHDKVNNKWRAQPQSTTSGGAVAGRVFIDENNNDLYDEGEKLVNADVRIDRAAVTLDENGFFVAPVAPYGMSKVEINASTLSDPLLTPKTKGYRVQTRPGDTVVADFPLVHTTIIDGTSYFLEGDTKREIGNIVIELQDKDNTPIRRVISEIDGYYSFDKVQKGEYWISVPDEVLSSINATLTNKIHIKIDEIDGFISDNNILLQQKVDLTAPPSFGLPTPNLPPTPALPAPPISPTLPTSVKEEKTIKEKADNTPNETDSSTGDSNEVNKPIHGSSPPIVELTP
ncbi:MAG: hypothetical protein WC612_07015 [Bdellovibrionales bacterium]